MSAGGEISANVTEDGSCANVRKVTKALGENHPEQRRVSI